MSQGLVVVLQAHGQRQRQRQQLQRLQLQIQVAVPPLLPPPHPAASACGRGPGNPAEATSVRAAPPSVWPPAPQSSSKDEQAEAAGGRPIEKT